MNKVDSTTEVANRPRTSLLAKASFGLAILAIYFVARAVMGLWARPLDALAIVHLGAALAATVAAVICGHTALVRIKKGGCALRGKGLAVAGAVLAYLQLLAAAGLAITAAKGLQEERGKAMIVGTRESMQTIRTAINAYEVDTGRYPPDLRSLVKNDAKPGWQGPYIRGEEPMDAWGNAYHYESTRRGCRVVSGGPDKKIGTSDDIEN